MLNVSAVARECRVERKVMQARARLVYTGTRRYQEGPIEVVPVGEFLAELAELV